MDRLRFVTTLTLLRFPVTLVGWGAALQGLPQWAGAIAILGIALDIADGDLARRWSVVTRRGSELDSIADGFLFASLAGWTILLVAEVRSLVVPVAGFLAAYLVVFALNYHWRRSVAAHTPITRAVVGVGVGTAIWFLWFGYTGVMAAGVAVALVVDLAHRVHLGWSRRGAAR